MGGDRLNPHRFTPDSDEEESSLDNDLPQTATFPRNNSSSKVSDGLGIGTSVNRDNGSVAGESNEGEGSRCSSVSWDFEADQRRKLAVYRDVLKTYDQSQPRIESLGDAKNKILSYTPGAWIENVGGMKLRDYDVPKTTSLVLIGPKGSGKSSLINRISKAFEDDKFASERAQVTYNSSVGDGTHFLHEYMIPRGSNSFCIYDTRSLSDDSSDNINMIKHWIRRGVRHGELVIRKSDSSYLKNRMKWKARESDCQHSEIRMVNFFILVVDGLVVLKSIKGGGDLEKQYVQMIETTFNCPYLSFKDDKPVVVVTHGDLLSLTDRASIRTHLGELLGISPAKQIFDIPESSDLENEVIIVDMLRYCLEHADRNLPPKKFRNKVPRVSVLQFVYLLIILGIVCIAVAVYSQQMHTHRMHIHSASKPDIQSTTKPDTRSASKPDIQSTTKPDTHSASKPDIRSTPKPDTHSARKPNTHSTHKPDDIHIDWGAIRHMWL